MNTSLPPERVRLLASLGVTITTPPLTKEQLSLLAHYKPHGIQSAGVRKRRKEQARTQTQGNL